MKASEMATEAGGSGDGCWWQVHPEAELTWFGVDGGQRGARC